MKVYTSNMLMTVTSTKELAFLYTIELGERGIGYLGVFLQILIL
jgi:hypothetical protein